MLPLMRTSHEFYLDLHKVADIVLMITFAFLVMGVVNICEDYVYLSRYALFS